jgi:hypothetical protein
VAAVDRFYEDPLNAPIAIRSAMQIVARRAKGDDEAAIQQ